MLQLGAPRARGRAPLGSARQVGLARNGPSRDLGGTRGSLTPACAWFHLSGSPGDEGRAGLVGPWEGQWAFSWWAARALSVRELGGLLAPLVRPVL